MVHSNTAGNESVACHYVLHAYERLTERFVERCFSTLEDLALALFEANRPAPHWYGNDGPTQYSAVHAKSWRGRPLDVACLIAFGAKVYERQRRRASWFRVRDVAGYVRRSGPVFGIRKGRGGRGRSSLRHINERRAAALVVREDGEVGPRPARGLHGLPNPWDIERWRDAPRCWKSQHKGRKAWDRG